MIIHVLLFSKNELTHVETYIRDSNFMKQFNCKYSWPEDQARIKQSQIIWHNFLLNINKALHVTLYHQSGQKDKVRAFYVNIKCKRLICLGV